MANGEMKNGKTIYTKKFQKVGERTVFFVHSKWDDSLLFETSNKLQLQLWLLANPTEVITDKRYLAIN